MHRLFRQQRVDDREARLRLGACAAAECRSRRLSDRAAPRGDGRTCRGRCPGRRGARRSRPSSSDAYASVLGEAPVQRQLAGDHLAAVARSRCATRGCSVKSGGNAMMRSPSDSQARRLARRCCDALGPVGLRVARSSRPCTCCRSCRARRAPAVAPSSSPCAILLDHLRRHRASRQRRLRRRAARRRAARARRVLADDAGTSRGCVAAGSSASLWP